ncbi:Dopamine D2-like receptor [Nymphon striatum]|nr:Dopamine D2-like receptor [Nymphon striatum]KAG1686748.1 Dopamine D2-like receptor [Nymphon striatum]
MLMRQVRNFPKHPVLTLKCFSLSNFTTELVVQLYDKESKSEVKDNGVVGEKTEKELVTVKHKSKAQTKGTAAAIDKKKKKSRFALSMVHKSSRKKKRDKGGYARRERKATKTLAIVLGMNNNCF